MPKNSDETQPEPAETPKPEPRTCPICHHPSCLGTCLTSCPICRD